MASDSLPGSVMRVMYLGWYSACLIGPTIQMSRVSLPFPAGPYSFSFLFIIIFLRSHKLTTLSISRVTATHTDSKEPQT